MAEIVFVTIPQETVNDQSVRILSWAVASGTAVREGDHVCEIETSKAVLEMEAPSDGIVFYRAATGSEVAVGATLFQLVPEGMEAAAFPSENVTETGPTLTHMDATHMDALCEPIAVASSPEHLHASRHNPARLTALAAKIAAEAGLSAESFPRGTLVRRDDVLRRLGRLPEQPARQRGKSVEEDAPAQVVPGVAVTWADLPRRKVFEGRVLRNGRSQTVQSSVTAPLRIGNLRARTEALSESGTGLCALVIYEASRLLTRYPELNAVCDRGRIGTYAAINIAWAVDGGEGLSTPVVQQPQTKSLQEIASLMDGHVERYVEGALTPADFLGGTFTVSDLSLEGITHFEPLISQGQSGILGIGAEREADGERLYLTLAFDHQLLEGRKAARFLRELAERLEAHNPPTPAAAVPESAEARHYAEARHSVEARDSVEVPHCALCFRDKDELLRLKEMLVRSEVPEGFVCSICLAGFA